MGAPGTQENLAVGKDQCNRRTQLRVHFLYKTGNICTMWPQAQVPGWDGRKFNTSSEKLFFFFL